ncbi:MAG: NUDIX domain-containing protein [Candidatus Pacebacteria bacterium]|nr:NUDIX domain-containing protein [Candidatus Paceibacterota bacterium]
MKKNEKMFSVAVIIMEGEKILLVRPRGKLFWTLPGGEIVNGESDVKAVFRQICDKKLPNTQIKSLRRYHTFYGECQDYRDSLVTAYIAETEGSFEAGSDVEEVLFSDAPLPLYLSGTARSIIENFLGKRS